MAAQSLVHEVNLTDARELSPLYTEAVREGRPVVIHRRGDADAVLTRLELLRELLQPYTFHVHYYEEDADDEREGEGGGGYTIEVEELNLAAYGETLQAARAALLASVRSFVQHYLDSFDRYLHFQDKVAMRFHVSRLALARGDEERAEMLFGQSWTVPVVRGVVGI